MPQRKFAATGVLLEPLKDGIAALGVHNFTPETSLLLATRKRHSTGLGNAAISGDMGAGLGSSGRCNRHTLVLIRDLDHAVSKNGGSGHVPLTAEQLG